MSLFNTLEVPEERSKRVEKLETAMKTLKAEFVGLDEIIDQISNSIYGWYITPEVVTRPTIISIWGMTGTGKTSVVKRLIELLGLSNISIAFDCGLCRTNKGDSFIDDVKSTFGIENVYGREDDLLSDKAERSVFLFDEFQYANTIDGKGNEEVLPGLRPIWSILDSGILDLTDNTNYRLFRLLDLIDSLELLSDQFPDIIIENNRVIPEDFDRFIGYMSYFYDFSTKPRKLKAIDKPAEIDNEFPIIDFDKIKYLIQLNRLEPNLGTNIVNKLTRSRLSILELVNKLKEARDLLTQKKFLDCSKSLVFVVGNLDEAYKESSKISPDLDADMFYDITSKISTTEIKKALKERFRPEQIGRLGNNIIKYPTLRRKDIEKIIDLEIKKRLDGFSKIDPIKIEVTKAFKDLLYSESVYPTQGVRPILTSIDSLITPYLSKVLSYKGDSSEVVIDIESDNPDFRVPSVNVVLKFNKADDVRLIQNLELGKERCPENRKKRYIAAVHEVGHAIVYSHCKGEVPTNIVGIATGGGGFCTTYDKRFAGEIQSREDIQDEVLISLGGYVAEGIVFDKPNKRLLGSSSDIDSVWNTLTNAAMNCGYFEPIPISHREVENSNKISRGLSSLSKVICEKTSDDLIRDFIRDAQQEVRNILSNEKELLKNASLVLGEKGIITGSEFEELIQKYGNGLNTESMKRRYEERDEKYYKETLMNL